MGISKNWNGKDFKIAEDHEKKRTWGSALSAFLLELADNALARYGGSFHLSGADVDWGPDYGHKMIYLKSNSSDIAQSGVLRLANNEGIGFRNAANTADLIFKANVSDQLTYNGTVLGTALDLNALDIAKLDRVGGTGTNLTIADRLTFTEGTLPATPAAGKVALYPEADHKFYVVDSTGAKSQLGGGGLTPVAVTALPSTLANGAAYQVSPVAASSGALPVTALAATIEVTDVTGNCSATNFLGVTPGGSDTILFKGVASTDRIVGRRKFVTMRFNKAAGSSVWTVTIQTILFANAPTYLEIKQVGSSANFPANNVFGDMGFIDLTGGTWDLSLFVSAQIAGATGTYISGAVTTTAGNSSAGTVVGDNYGDATFPTSTFNSSVSIPSIIRVVPPGTTVRYYAKVVAGYTAGQPTYRGRLTAKLLPGS